MTPNEASAWQSQHQTPILYNHHAPIQLEASTIEKLDMNKIVSTIDAVKKEQRVLLLTPIRNAGHYLPKYFELIAELTYPHHLIDLAFLVSDSDDDTEAILAKELDRIQTNKAIAFRSAMVVVKDFGVTLKQEVQERHGWEAQGPRRKALGQARNFLLSTALKSDHSWVYWRDADIVESPKELIEDFIAHDRDVIVPNIWFHRFAEVDGKMVDIEGRFDYNSWQETSQSIKAIKRKNLDRDFIIAEGYKKHIDTKRKYMATEGNRHADKDYEWKLDGIGGVSILVKADVHRSGINFPMYAFENQAETEGFAKMAKRAGFGVYGLPNYVVWHIDTEEKGGNN
jgi:hypothetical protein